MTLTQISTAGVKDDAVTAGKIPANAVGSSELADNAVDTAAIADDAVTSAKIADGTIVAANIANDTITAVQLANNSANINVIVDGAVSTAKIADDAVTAAKIQDGEVTQGKLASNSVTTNKIAGSAVTSGELANSAVTTAKIADGAVTDGKIGAGQISVNKLANGSVHGSKIADQAVTLDKLPHGTSSNDGKFLRANNGADPTFETVSTDLVADTSPQLGGDLDANGNNIAVDGGNNITIGDNGRLRLGNSQDLDIFHDGTNSRINSTTGKLMLKDDNIEFVRAADDTVSFAVYEGGATDLYHNHNKRIETTDNGALVQTEGDCYLTILADNDNNQTNNWPLIDFRINNLSGTTEARIAYREDNSVLKFDIAGSEKVGINGNGLVFNGDTAAANALDDYEEGTWTPVIMYYGTTWSNATLDAAGTISVPQYTKIGRWVTASFNWEGFKVNSGTTAYAQIGGLPFTATATGAGLVSLNNCFAMNQEQGAWVANGQTTAQFYRQGLNWNNWNSNSGVRLQLTCHYQAS